MPLPKQVQERKVEPIIGLKRLLLMNIEGCPMYRVIHRDATKMYVIQVGHRTPEGVFIPQKIVHPFSMLQTWNQNDIKVLFDVGTIVRRKDVGIPSYMRDYWLPLDDIHAFRKRSSVINFMLNRWGAKLLTSSHERSNAVRAAAVVCDVDKESVRLWLVRHFFFGCHPASLLLPSDAPKHRYRGVLTRGPATTIEDRFNWPKPTSAKASSQV